MGSFTHHHTEDEGRESMPTLQSKKDLSGHKQPVAKNWLSAIFRHCVTTWGLPERDITPG